MTDAEKQSLTEHLATKVCGWHDYRTYWCRSDDTYIISVDVFKPITDPRDTALVMEKWQRHGNGLDINMDAYAKERPWTVTTNYGDEDGRCSDAHETMPEAVCLAIGRASGWEGERS